MTGAFEGLEVLELTWGIAGPMAAMMLADQGARVTRIEPPEDPLADHPGYRVWNRGKRSAVIDLHDAEGRRALLRLVGSADVVLDSFRPGVTERLAIDHQSLASVNPKIITCSVTAYGEGNKDSNRPGYEALVAARTGSQWAQRGGIMSTGDLGLADVEIPEGAEQAARADGPIFSASPWMSINGFYATSLALTAALVARQRTGLGQHIETSMLGRAAFATSSAREGGSAVGGSWMNLKGAPRGLFECGDGRWVHQWPIKPQSILDAAEHDHLEDAPLPDYPHRRVDPARIGMEPENIVVLFYYLPLMQAAFKKFPAEDWRRWGERVHEGVQIVRSAEEALSDPTLIDDGCVVEVDDPQLGAIRHLGVIIEHSGSARRVQGPAPLRGEHTDEVLAEAASRPQPELSPAVPPAPGAGPLSGVRVLDIGLALAGPYGSSLLADLGADVVKVMAPWDGPWMDTGIGQMANRGKRGVLLHLGKPNGRAAFLKLVETADVVSHNMRWGVAERLGVGYEDLRAVNPSIIYCASRGFDHDRSARNLPGTDQSGSALAGQEWEDGGCWRGGRPFFGTSMGDLGNGFLVAIGIVEAIYHRDRTGEGQEVGCSILGACLATSSGTYAFPDGHGPDRPKLDSMQLGFNALYRLYETGDGWICIAAVTDSHWQRLCDAIGRGDLRTDGRFAEPSSRRTHDDDLTKLLEEIFSERPAADWFATLDAAGVPVEISKPGFVAAAADRPFIHFSATPALVPGEAPVLDQHTDEILAELRLSDDLIAAIKEETADRARG